MRNIQGDAVRANLTQVIEAMQQDRLAMVEKHKKLPFSLQVETGRLFKMPPSPMNGCISIELVLNLEKQEALLKAVDLEILSKTARQVISETCAVIKRMMASIHDLRQFAFLELPAETGRGVLHEAWFAVDRDEAERLLLTAQPGSYLFRKDPFAGCLEELLALAKKETIKCFTLTYLDSANHVCDKTIIQEKDRWMFYDDDPTLSGDYYSSFDDLLLSMKSVLKTPLHPAKSSKP